MILPWSRKATSRACHHLRPGDGAPPERSALDRALDRWLGRSQAVAKIAWNLAASVLAVGLVAAALGLIDWSPAYVALLPERAHEAIKVLRRPAP